MTAPTVVSVTLDKLSYAPGETATADIVYTPGTTDVSFTVTATATDNNTGQTGQLDGIFSVASNDPTSISLADTGGHVWNRVSDDGVGHAVWSTTV